MAEPTPTALVRSNDAIESDILHIMRSFPPLTNDRHRIKIEVQDGAVTVSGYVKSKPTYLYLLNKLVHIPGVKSIQADELHDDGTIRLDVGHVVPAGIQVVVEYGAVILAGSLPDGMTVDELVRDVALVPGVHRVLTAFND